MAVGYPLCRVWRVEHKETRRGPFVTDYDGAHPVWHTWHKPYGIPATHDWRGYERPLRGPHFETWNGWRFAFSSLNALLKWCDEEALQDAHAGGFVVGLYGAAWTEHALYRDQVLYDPRTAVHLRDVGLLDLEVERALKCHREMVARAA